MITSMTPDKISELEAYWKKSNLIPVIEEHDTGLTQSDNRVSSFSNFCPEVSFEFFGYYADYLSRYVDEIDRDCGVSIATRDKIENDWRYSWQTVRGIHYLDCKVYHQTTIYNSEKKGKFEDSIHENIIVLIHRMETCLERDDNSGVIHASASIFETMAKDIIEDQKIQEKTLGSFIEKFNKESKLPDNVKNFVKEMYSLRNTSPLSGHGSIKPEEVSKEDAIVLVAMTKAVVEIEYRARKI
jgi:hypothetical protein